LACEGVGQALLGDSDGLGPTRHGSWDRHPLISALGTQPRDGDQDFPERSEVQRDGQRSPLYGLLPSSSVSELVQTSDYDSHLRLSLSLSMKAETTTVTDCN